MRNAIVVFFLIALLTLWVVRLLNPCDLQLLGNIVGPGDVVNVGKPAWLQFLC